MSVLAALRARVPERWAKRWPTIRAILITYHVAAVGLLAVPAPYGVMSESLWKEPTVQSEFRAWAGHLGAVGIEVTPQALEDSLWSASHRFLSARDVVTAPFKPYERYAGVEQSWRMFGAPNMYPVRLEMSVKEADRWRRVYVSRSDEATWMRLWFDDHALRRVVFKGGLAKNKARYEVFCDWLAERAAADFPEATDLLVRQYRYRIPTPAQAREGQKVTEGRYENREFRSLGGLR